MPRGEDNRDLWKIVGALSSNVSISVIWPNLARFLKFEYGENTFTITINQKIIKF